VSDKPSRFTDRVTTEADKRPPVEQFTKAIQNAVSPIAGELQATVTRLIDEHSLAVNAQVREAIGTVADIVTKHVACELAERDEVIRRLSERITALEAATGNRG